MNYKKRTINKYPLSYISLFSSAGVGCYGFLQEKFNCVATLEIIKRRLDVQKANKKCKSDSGYILGDIKDNNVKEQLFKEITKWKNGKKGKEITVLVATPPCQGMSVANHKKKNEKIRNSLVVESIVLTQKIKPLFFIFENVRGFLNTVCTDLDGTDKRIEDAININLGGLYNIESKILNFKDYGNKSSRTRTLVVGVRNDILDLAPCDMLPDYKKCPNLNEVIGNLPPLEVMGESLSSDIFHNFRKYNPKMLPWIENLQPGESAFDNTEPLRIPHRIVNGEIIYNKNKNGDKYKRCEWIKPGPCIHTRNDIFASQNTIHPKDNRVFSIRELMRLMTIPDSFKWSKEENEYLNSLDTKGRQSYLSKNEVNIRQSIGEAVPTAIFHKIAKKIKKWYKTAPFDKTHVKSIISENNLESKEKLSSFIDTHFGKFSFYEWSKIIEYANASRENNAAFFTPRSLGASVVSSLPDYKTDKQLSILEPSVGTGAFLPLIIDKYRHIDKVEIDVVDIDSNAIFLLKKIINKIKIPSNFTLNYICEDFLLENSLFTKIKPSYDIVIANPPFKKFVGSSHLLNQYKRGKFNQKTNNLASMFLEKALKIAKDIAFVLPKSIISSPEYNLTRELINSYFVKSIHDFGENGFEGVKIETIGICLKKQKIRSRDNDILIYSHIDNNCRICKQNYIFSKDFPYALLYRDDFFDQIAGKLKFGVFTAIRDRQITKKDTSKSGKYRVIKSRNIGDLSITNDLKNDEYINDIIRLNIKKFLNKSNIILVPNLTYHPRAAYLPKNSVPDGSVAILTPVSSVKINDEDLKYYATDEFHKFYMIARNKGTRSLNIDSNSVFFFGLKK